ncbi:MAG: PKD domain-containing protein, partial [Thermoplasmatota archaeon]
APQSYRSYIVTLLETAFDATRNLTFLEPLRLEAEIAQEYLDDPDPRPDAGTRKWAGSILGTNAVSTYQNILDKYGLPGGGPSSTLWRPPTVVDSCEDGYHYIRKCYPLMTTEASATDRALFIGVANPFLIFTGGSIGGALLAPLFTYSGLERDFAAMVRDANSRKANISFYGFFEGGREAAILPWALEVGGRYRLVGGPDENGDGVRERDVQFVNFTYLNRGQKVSFELPGGKGYLVSIEQLQAGSGLRPLIPDPAFDAGDEVLVDKENGTVTVKVHNIGSMDADRFDILLYEDLDGGLRHIGGALDVTIPAPGSIQPSIMDIDLTVWYEPWFGEVFIKIDPDDDMLEISDSNNELRGYWDLEGIKVTEPDLPVEFNGTIPTILANEDEPLYDALDLDNYIWDPDGHGLAFDLSPPSYSSQWVPIMDGGKVSFIPSPLFGANWSGRLVFEGTVWGPGKDGLWETEDDTETYHFDVVLEVRPVNDAPSIDAIVANGTRHLPGEKGFEFELQLGEPFMGEVEWSDVDGDQAYIGLEGPSYGLVLQGGMLIMKSYHDIDLITTFLNITDNNGSALQHIPLTVRVIMPPEPAFLGLYFDGENLSVPFDGEKVKITIAERDEITVHFIFQNAPEAYVIHFSDPGIPPPTIIDLHGRSAVITGIEVRNASEVFELDMGWVLGPDRDGWAVFKLVVTVLNVNRPPTGLGIQTEGPFYVNEEVVFTVTEAADPDGEELTYTVDWGDGSGAGIWTPGEELRHVFGSTGTFRVTVTVKDSWGAIQTRNISIEVGERGAPDDDDIEDDDAYDNRSGVFYAILILVAVIFMLVLIGAVILLVRNSDDEEKMTEHDEGDPLVETLYHSIEE